jgi:hypothetical protein
LFISPVTFTFNFTRPLPEETPRMSRNLLLQSVLGHLALLAEKHPKKAASPVARRAKQYVKLTLQPQPQQTRARAA